MRCTKRAASAGSSSAPSASTSALARIAATGFLSSWERSDANVSTKGRPSSSRRMISSACVRRMTSRPWGAAGGDANSCPSLTRTAKSVSFSIGEAIVLPIRAAEIAAATPRPRLMIRMVGAKSSSVRWISSVRFTTCTDPTRAPSTSIGTVTATLPGAPP